MNGNSGTEVRESPTTANKKIRSYILWGAALGIVLVVLFFATDLSTMVFHHKEYQAYQCAKESVLEQLAFPDTADFPSFGDVTIRSSQKSTQLILESATSGGNDGFERAWDVSGTVVSENALGMKCNSRFFVTVVLRHGRYECYHVEL